MYDHFRTCSDGAEDNGQYPSVDTGDGLTTPTRKQTKEAGLGMFPSVTMIQCLFGIKALHKITTISSCPRSSLRGQPLSKAHIKGDRLSVSNNTRRRGPFRRLLRIIVDQVDEQHVSSRVNPQVCSGMSPKISLLVTDCKGGIC